MSWLQFRAVRGKKGRHQKNKSRLDGLRWVKKENESEEVGGLMVKGLSRRVIVVRAPDERIFEQAIFIIREDFAARSGAGEIDILRQAQEAADEYLRECGAGTKRGLFSRLRPPLYAAAGAAATAAAWFALNMVRI